MQRRKLIRIHLRLLKNLTDRSCISPTHCSNEIKTWIQLLSETIGQLVAWLPKESAMETMPKIFKTGGHGKLRCIIECFEAFLVRPSCYLVKKKAFSKKVAASSDCSPFNLIVFDLKIEPLRQEVYITMTCVLKYAEGKCNMKIG